MSGLSDRFGVVLEEASGTVLEGGPIVVAISGGLDSAVLLHLFRFGVSTEHLDIHAAHFDHRMRGGSRADADWVQGLCAAWEIPLTREVAWTHLDSEESARNARYAFLDSVRRAVGADVVATAHHADDQAETVLFRVVRGTGGAGLAGMAAYREPGLWRPLLDFWRDDIQGYARSVGLGWREDPTNTDDRYARNAIRNAILPELEARVASQARRSLVRLASLAQEQESAWSSLLPGFLDTLSVDERETSTSFDFEAMSRLHPGVRGRIVRELARRLGTALSAERTRSAVEFCSSARSGRGVQLGGGLTLRRDLNRLALTLETGRVDDRQLLIADARPGSGTVILGGREFVVVWELRDTVEPEPGQFALPAPRFPLTVRARQAGDRIRLGHGTTRLKKLLLDARVPEPDRGQQPLLVDGSGAVLWVPGIAQAAPGGQALPEQPVLHIGITDADAE